MYCGNNKTALTSQRQIAVSPQGTRTTQLGQIGKERDTRYGLDIVGADVEAILRSAEAEIDKVK